MNCLALLLLFFSAATASFKTGYVIGGEDADITDWPFMVSLQSLSGDHFCGGVLFDSIHVLTAAHCVDGDSPSQIQIMVGFNSISEPGDVYGLTDIVIHEDYGEKTFYGDVALLFVDGEVVADGVNVDFGVLAETDAEDFAGSDCEIAGWGRTVPGDDDSASDILQFAPVNVISVEECQEDWPLSEQHICNRDDNGEISGCHGDSGGPMSCIDSSVTRVITGTTVGGSADCTPGKIGVWARTSFFYQWIQDNM